MAGYESENTIQRDSIGFAVALKNEFLCCQLITQTAADFTALEFSAKHLNSWESGQKNHSFQYVYD